MPLACTSISPMATSSNRATACSTGSGPTRSRCRASEPRFTYSITKKGGSASRPTSSSCTTRRSAARNASFSISPSSSHQSSVARLCRNFTATCRLVVRFSPSHTSP